MSSLYLHIPFCRSKCFYCSFASWAGREHLLPEYLEAIKQESAQLAARYGQHLSPLQTLFVGGGTPTSMAAARLCELLSHCLAHFQVAKGAEISVESNPCTVDRSYLGKLLEAGVNRISFGVQSCVDAELALIGRTHRGRDAELAVKSAQQAGFVNINIDLMYGIPGQTVKSWESSLQQAMDLGVQHLSLYQLTIEEETPCHTLVQRGDLVLPSEDIVLEMEAVTRRLCSKFGFGQYEISNFCREGFACLHNINYWHNANYLAAGAAAVSYIDGAREKRFSDIENYITASKKGLPVIKEREELSREASFRETVIMGLRMVTGVSRSALVRRYHMDVDEHYGQVVQDLVEQGFIELTETHLKISPKGWPLSNQIMAQLV